LLVSATDLRRDIELAVHDLRKFAEHMHAAVDAQALTDRVQVTHRQVMEPRIEPRVSLRCRSTCAPERRHADVVGERAGDTRTARGERPGDDARQQRVSKRPGGTPRGALSPDPQRDDQREQRAPARRRRTG
jgi:hypothetical protein